MKDLGVTSTPSSFPELRRLSSKLRRLSTPVALCTAGVCRSLLVQAVQCSAVQCSAVQCVIQFTVVLTRHLRSRLHCRLTSCQHRLCRSQEMHPLSRCLTRHQRTVFALCLCLCPCPFLPASCGPVLSSPALQLQRHSPM